MVQVKTLKAVDLETASLRKVLKDRRYPQAVKNQAYAELLRRRLKR